MILQGRLLVEPPWRPIPGWVEVVGGAVAALGEGAPPGRAALGHDRAVITPGFIDAHIHLPQIDAVGFDGLELLDWLRKVIYPAEGRWSDAAFARRQCDAAYGRMLAAGTLGYGGYLTSHTHAPGAAAGAGGVLPLRARAGQVLMDRNAPADLIDHAPASLDGGPRLESSVNPRFAVACTDGLLARAAASARDGAWIQTHLAESIAECRLVASLFPDDPHYTGVYDRHGLLTPRTLLAHCLHLDDEQWTLIAERGSVAVHCPTANTFLGAGVFDLAAALEHHVRIALGSDVAAGPDIAMPRVARAMIDTAKLRSISGDDRAVIPTASDAWHLITRANADALGWSDAGRLEPGAAADLLLLEPPFDIDEHLVSRLLYTWDDAYIAHRIVAGEVVERPDHERGD